MQSTKKKDVKRKHRTLSIVEKVEILKKKLDNDVSVKTICETYAISSILKLWR